MLKGKMLKVAAVTLTILFICSVAAYAAVNPYVVYGNRAGGNVQVFVYFNSEAGEYDTVKYGSGMNAASSDLDWNTLTINGTDPKKYVEFSATEYMNYFVKISSVSDNVYARVFPVTVPYTGPDAATRQFNDYAHGNFRPGTPMCGACHSTHSALKEQLLNKVTYYDLCMLCHSNANSQSKYDVEGGLVQVSGGTQPSLAGPFVSQSGFPAISLHNANDGTNSSVDVPGSDLSKDLKLTCVSCHNGHSRSDDNYRLLKKTIYADDGRTLAANNIDFDAFAITGGPSSGEELFMVKGNSEFCSACHLDYDNGNAWAADGVYDSDVTPGPGIARYRHPVSVGSVVYSVYYNYYSNPYYTAYPSPNYNSGIRNENLAPAAGDTLPLQYNPYTDAVTEDKRTLVVCLTCHFAHGSTKSFTIQDSANNNKYMLRLDNYGTCESCHKK